MFIALMACMAMRQFYRSSEVKHVLFFRFCLSTSSQIMESLLTEQLIKLDFYYHELYFFLKTRRQKMSRSYHHASNGKLALD